MADWDVEVSFKTPMTNEDHKLLRHHPMVVAELAAIAEKIVAATGYPDDFGVLVQNVANTQRARAFAKPTSKHGVHLELTESVLLKAAGSAGHQQIESAPSSGLISAGERQGEFDIDAGGSAK